MVVRLHDLRTGVKTGTDLS